MTASSLLKNDVGIVTQFQIFISYLYRNDSHLWIFCVVMVINWDPISLFFLFWWSWQASWLFYNNFNSSDLKMDPLRFVLDFKLYKIIYCKGGNKTTSYFDSIYKMFIYLFPSHMRSIYDEIQHIQQNSPFTSLWRTFIIRAILLLLGDRKMWYKC